MITYCTAIWTHHQSEVCVELHKLLGAEFKLILTLPLDQPLSKERIAMGWNLVPPETDWIVGPPATAEAVKSIDYDPYIVDSDVAIIGWIPFVDDALIKRRIKSGKITIFQGERFFRQPRRWFDYINPRVVRRWLMWWWKLHYKNVYYLTMNHWCKEDLCFLHGCKGRTFRWGYLIHVEDVPPVKPAHKKVRIGWCGRMIDCKRVNYIIRAVAFLPSSVRHACEVELVGDGDQRNALAVLTEELGLGNVVRFHDSIPSDKVGDYMRGLDIYVFPSDRREGWGAVLPEAMTAGCAVIASDAAGSTLELIENGQNGYVFKDGDVSQLSNCLMILIQDATLRESFGHRAWLTMQEWRPKVGADRLRNVIRAIQCRNVLPQYHGLGELIH